MLKCTAIVIIVTQLGWTHCAFKEMLRFPTQSPEDVISSWTKVEEGIKTLVERGIKQAMPMFVRLSSEINLSPECYGGLVKLLLGIRDVKDWAMKMLDATGKPPGGILMGSTLSLGSYQECLDISRVNGPYGATENNLRGMYCLLDIRLPMPPRPKVVYANQPLPLFQNYTIGLEMIENLKDYIGVMYAVGLKIGICVPSLCTKQDIEEIAAVASRNIKVAAKVISCEVKEGIVIDTTQLAIIIVLGMLIFFVALATVIQWRLSQRAESKPGLFHRFIDCFSLTRNFSDLLRASNAGKQDKTLAFLHGLRFISMTWVVLLHTNIFYEFTAQRDPLNFEGRIKSISHQVIYNSSFSVDTFFFASAVLLALNVKQWIEYKRHKPIPILFLRRVLRLLPVAMLTVGLAIILPLLGSGPLWKYYVEEQADNCRRNWWAVALFANNFIVKPLDMCMMHSWYVSADLQLYAVGLIIVAVYFRNAQLAKAILIILAIVAILTTTAVLYFMDIIPTILFMILDLPMIIKYAKYVYITPYGHMAVYMVGLAVGIFLAENEKLTLKLPLRLFGWTMATVCNLFVVYVAAYWNSGEHVPLGLVPSIYGGLSRPLWVLGLAWLSINCARGYGGLINKFLSWGVFVKLNELSYLVYLIHFLVIIHHQASLTGQVESSDYAMIRDFIGNLFISLGLAFPLWLFFEAPVKNIESLAFKNMCTGRSSKRVENRDSVQKTENANDSLPTVCCEVQTKL